MPIDYWLIFACTMIVFSVILCGILPVIFRLYNARQRFHGYQLEPRAMDVISALVLLDNNVRIDLNQNCYPDLPFMDDPSTDYETPI